MPPRIIFFGTAELACPSLETLAFDTDYAVLSVVTQPDKPRGRDLQLQPTPVKATALRLNLPVLQPARARDPQFIAELAQLKPDLIVVAAYGQILPQALLDLPEFGCLNVHTSLLPRHRGAAPIQSAILSGDDETGVTIMLMDAGLDTGPMLTQRKSAILPGDNAQTLHDRLATIGAELLAETIPLWIEGSITPQPQPEGATYAHKIEKADGLIDWTEPARVVWRKVRAYTPWPGAFTFLETGGRKRIKIWETEPLEQTGAPGVVQAAGREGIEVGCGSGSLRVVSLQPEGRKRMSASEFLAGNALAAGQVFTR